MNKLDTLAKIAANLTEVLRAEDRYQRLLEAIRIAIPYDAATLLKIKGEILTPLATKGLTPDTLGRKFNRNDHPRLDIVCNSREPVIFTETSKLPDPFDGLLALDRDATTHIHACLGFPLYVGGQLVGILTADALNPNAFKHLPQQYLKVIGLMAGAQMQTADLLTALEAKAERQGQIASDLMENIHTQKGREILGKSKGITDLRQEIELVARSDFTILVLGETGVGKELVARAIHSHSTRKHSPLLYLNCASLPDSLAESELFGHLKGGFTGATGDRTGKFELADGGTLFLDEIGELSLEIQAKILRTIQEGEIQRIGSEKMIHVDVRLIAATNRNLEEEVSAGRFRADLFHRLNVYPLKVPPLRERKEDIAILAGYFAERSRGRLGLQQVRISTDSLQLLSRYSWPGNVRELENIISRSILKASAQATTNDLITLLAQHLAGDLGSAAYTSPPPAEYHPPAVTTKMSLREEIISLQKNRIREELERNGGNWAAAARALDMNRSNLHNLATRLGLRRKSPE